MLAGRRAVVASSQSAEVLGQWKGAEVPRLQGFRSKGHLAVHPVFCREAPPGHSKRFVVTWSGTRAQSGRGALIVVWNYEEVDVALLRSPAGFTDTAERVVFKAGCCSLRAAGRRCAGNYQQLTAICS